ncbi:hypothetical protein HM1_2789 [Heliomicrobium modesticaldum Ice1]|uniref:Uncharacterized protein n=1 Tax=Heliobacterium modesticaldum (strain ATCC 51547 / Ice1) TaxID=498761 RepID=B0TCD0_HELMI|nr:hypothetical protein [Heliomicrobium modesticaldum]ABZ85318.1 hypothetical protein HM1_2789 [Heliomicrobium modesticaldum Ice1]
MMLITWGFWLVVFLVGLLLLLILSQEPVDEPLRRLLAAAEEAGVSDRIKQTAVGGVLRLTDSQGSVAAAALQAGKGL